MLKDIKWLTVITVFIIVSLLLFVGYYAFQTINIKNPIITSLEKVESVVVNDLIISNDLIELNVNIDNPEDFQSTYQQITTVMSSYEDKRKINVKIENNADNEMLLAWRKSYFNIAQAIEQKEYSMIPTTIQRLQEENLFDEVNSTMDERNIYIDLHKGDLAYYIVIPTKMGTEVSSIA